MQMKSKFFYFVASKGSTYFIKDGCYENDYDIEYLMGQTRALARTLLDPGWVIHKFERAYPHKYLGIVS